MPFNKKSAISIIEDLQKKATKAKDFHGNQSNKYKYHENFYHFFNGQKTILRTLKRKLNKL